LRRLAATQRQTAVRLHGDAKHIVVATESRDTHYLAVIEADYGLGVLGIDHESIESWKIEALEGNAQDCAICNWQARKRPVSVKQEQAVGIADYETFKAGE